MKKYFFYSLIFLLLACNNTNKKTDQTLNKNANSKPAELATLDSLIEATPRNAENYYLRALYYQSNGNIPKALADAYSAVYIDSSNVNYILLTSDLYLKNGKIDDAMATLKRGINNNKGNEQLYETMIEYSFYAKEYEQAINFTNDLIEINKFNANAYFFKGLIYRDLKNFDKAISSFQTCTEMDPQFYNAYMQLGLMYDSRNDNKAIQYFNNALRLDTNSREAKYGISYFYQKNEQYNKAIASYKEMARKNPKDHEVFFNIGHCYIALDSLDKAYKNFDIATKIQPQYTGAYYMKGYVSELAGNKEDAMANYTQALNMLPGDSTIQAAIKRVQSKG